MKKVEEKMKYKVGDWYKVGNVKYKIVTVWTNDDWYRVESYLLTSKNRYVPIYKYFMTHDDFHYKLSKSEENSVKEQKMTEKIKDLYI